MANSSAETIYVLNAPSLACSGIGVSDAHGDADFADVERLCAGAARPFGLKADCRQCGSEAELIDFIHEAQANQAAGIIIGAGDYSHASIALHQALLAAKIPAAEVHVSGIPARENFRDHCFTAKVAFATFTGFGIDGYRLAISGLAARIGVAAQA